MNSYRDTDFTSTQRNFKESYYQLKPYESIQDSQLDYESEMKSKVLREPSHLKSQDQTFNQSIDPQAALPPVHNSLEVKVPAPLNQDRVKSRAISHEKQKSSLPPMTPNEVGYPQLNAQVNNKWNESAA